MLTELQNSPVEAFGHGTIRPYRRPSAKDSRSLGNDGIVEKSTNGVGHRIE